LLPVPGDGAVAFTKRKPAAATVLSPTPKTTNDFNFMFPTFFKKVEPCIIIGYLKLYMSLKKKKHY
jgi:hypothetical protein